MELHAAFANVNKSRDAFAALLAAAATLEADVVSYLANQETRKVIAKAKLQEKANANT
jgi:hypothetical protein